MEKETDLELFILNTETMTESRFRMPQTQTRLPRTYFMYFGHLYL